VSASREKKTRQDDNPQGLSQRQLLRQKEEQDERRSLVTYTVVGIVTAVLAVLLVVWNSGVIQRSAAAVTVNGTKYSAAEVQYYMNSMLSQWGLSSSSASLKTTVMDEETGQTMYDYILEQVEQTLVTVTALSDQAAAEGYTMSQDAQDSVDSTLASLDSSWASLGYQSRDAFLRANYGSYMTYKVFVNLMTKQYLVSDYLTTTINAKEYTDSDYEAYYAEHADDLDSYTVTQYVFQASVSSTTTDADGNSVDLSDEEVAAALDEAKTEAKAKADELMARLKAGEDADTLAEEYADDLYSSSVSMVRTGTTSSYTTGLNSAYSEWAMDSARKDGDITLAEYDGGSTTYNYYVVRFEGRELDESATHDVRHILLSGDDAETEAQELLEQWKAGEATEDSFAQLAQDNSEDTSSATNGGLISGITPTSSYVESFRDWAVDSSRKAGDTGLVESSYGWHIMYYVGSGDPVWKSVAKSDLINDYYDEWTSAAEEGYEATTGFGLKFVKA
jgi:hypothetical protein